MVRVHLLIASFVLLISGLATAAPQSETPALQWKLDKETLQLGHHIRAELYGIGLRGKLSDISLQPLQEQFGFTLEETIGEMEDPRWPQQRVQRLLLKLYPRHTGTLTLPTLSGGGARSQSHSITVTAGINQSRGGDSPIEQHISVSSTQPWQRQQVRIEMEIITSDRFATLQAATPEITGFEVFALPAGSETLQRDGKELNRLHIGWSLFPLSSGPYTLDLPPIEYRKSGRSTRIYYLPRQTIEVKALPPYIPPTMPVGRIELASSLEAGPWLEPQTLGFWHLTLTGNGVSPSWMPPVLHHLHSDKALRFLPAKSELTPTATRNGLQSRITHHIPFKPGTNGRVKLPTLHIQYFDPYSGKILATTYHPPFAYSISMTWRALLIGLSGLAILLAGKILYSKLCQLVRRRRLRQAALAEIATASSAMNIRKALKLFSEAEGWPANMTLRDWARHWATRHRRSNDIDILIERLSLACYGKAPSVELDGLRRALLAQLR
jgi:hypothetical protein